MLGERCHWANLTVMQKKKKKGGILTCAQDKSDSESTHWCSSHVPCKTTEGGKHCLKKPVIQSASAPTFDVLGSLLSFCLSPLTLPNPCKERNHHWSKARSWFWGWGGHRFSLKSQRKLAKGHGRTEALPSTNSLTIGFAFTFDHFLLVSHCCRLQLHASLKSTQTWKCPISLSLGPNTASAGAGPGKLGWAISEVTWLWFPRLFASAVCGWYWWGNRFPVMGGAGITLDGAWKLGY